MDDFWLDVVARRLADLRSRRGVVRAMAGLMAGGSAVGRGTIPARAQQEQCGPTERLCYNPDGTLQCTDLANNPESCGACGRICPVGTQCVQFHCTGFVGERPPADVFWASAECREGPRPSGVFHDQFNEVTIGNGAGYPVPVVHIGSLTGPEQPGIPEFTLAPGETYRGLLARAIPDGEAVHGAIVTTDQGVLRLPCGDTGIPVRPRLVPPDDLEESAAAMARTLSLLESYWQFDALYALLHPDARQVSHTTRSRAGTGITCGPNALQARQR